MILGVEMRLAPSVDSELVQQELMVGTKEMLWENFRKMQEEWNVVHAEAIDLSRRVTRITGLVRPKNTKSQSARATRLMNNKSSSTKVLRSTGPGGIQPARSHSSPDAPNAAVVALSPKTYATEHTFNGGENPLHVHKGDPQVAREVQEAQLIDEACTGLLGSMFELRACELKTPDWSMLIDIERKVRVISKKRFEKKLAMEALVAGGLGQIQESRRSIETLKEIQRDEAALHPMNYEELVFKFDEGLANALQRLRLEYLQQQYGGGSDGNSTPAINEDSEYSEGPSSYQYHEDDARPTFEETRACMDACEVLLLGHGEVTLDFLTRIYPKGELHVLPSDVDAVGAPMGHRSTRHVRPMPRTWADLVTLEANRLQVPGVPAWKVTTDVAIGGGGSLGKLGRKRRAKCRMVAASPVRTAPRGVVSGVPSSASTQIKLLKQRGPSHGDRPRRTLYDHYAVRAASWMGKIAGEVGWLILRRRRALCENIM